MKIYYYLIAVCLVAPGCTKKESGKNIEISVNAKIGLSSNVAKNPYRLAIQDDHMFLLDPGSYNTVLHFDTLGNYLGSFGPVGQGPGELGNVSFFCGFNNNNIFISSWKVINIYNINTNQFIKRIVNKSFGRPVQLFLNYIVSWGLNDDYLLVANKLTDSLEISLTDSLLIGPYGEIPELLPCKYNPYLKQGQLFSIDSILYQSFYNSSDVVGYNSLGRVVFKTSKPNNYLMSEVGYGDFKHSPARNKYPEVNIAITGDNKYIYVLYSGTILKTQRDVLFNKGALGQGEILNVYDKHTSEFLGSYQLPYPVRDIVATQSCIYALSVDPEVAVYKLKKPLDM